MPKDICPSCGTPAQPGATRCAACGASLIEETTLRTVAQAGPPEVNAPPAPPASPVAPPAELSSGGVYPPPANAPASAPYPAPGVYGYPAAAPAPYGYAYGYPQAPAYSYYGWYGYYPPFAPVKPARAPQQTYRIVIASIVTGFSALSIICGLVFSILSLFPILLGSGDDLSYLGSTIGFTLAPILAGGFGLWYGIIGILRKPSPRFTLPSAWIMLGLVVVALAGALLLWNIDVGLARAPGAAVGVLPLAFLSGALPALTILAFTTQRLKDPSTRRHVWMSLFYGMTLASLLAVVLEGLAALVIAVALGLGVSAVSSVLSTNAPSSPQLLLAGILLASVVAPLVEEGVKPLGALLLIRRLRTPGEAFLVGLAAGIGFDMMETIGYIGMGQADWVVISIERIGAGLLHGVGAGMGALFWYYLINGKGVRLRWLRAAGAITYAVLQHGIFNGLNFVLSGQTPLLPQGVIDWLGQPFNLGALPLQRVDGLLMVIYALILTMLIVMTQRLPGARGMPEPPKPPAPQWPAGYPYSPYAPYPAMPWGYGQAPAPQPVPAPVAPLTTGGAR